jgi:beta-glucosidase
LRTIIFAALTVVSSLAHGSQTQTKTFDQLNVSEKLGQILQPDVRWITVDEVAKYNIGSVLRGGGTLAEEKQFPSEAINGPEAWAELVHTYKEAAKRSSSGLPLLFAIDAVHGHNNVTGATLFPHNIGLGAAADEDLVRQIGKATATEVMATGIDWNFAPTLAVARNERWGRTYESFSESTELVSRLGRAYLEGLQTELAPGLRMIGTAKHWIGDGGTTGGVDQGDTQLSLEELRATHLPPYLEAMKTGVQTVMASFNSFNGKKLHEHKFLITDVLKTELNFQGVVVSDWNAIDQIAVPPNLSDDEKIMWQIAKAFEAGVDVFMVPEKWKKFLELSQILISNHEKGIAPNIDPARLDDAVKRVMRLKTDSNLSTKPSPRDLYLNFKNDFGSAAHRALAHAASAKSAVLLKNKIGTLIGPGDKILVVGEKAKLTGPQAGGWSLDWQGTETNIPGSFSILDGIEEKKGAYNLKVTYADDVSVVADAEKIVLVLGEPPYAEGKGDRPDAGPKLSLQDEILLEKALATKLPVTLILISGRPLLLPDSVNQVSALISYWLPGSMGNALADLLVGEKPFTGKLSFSWPSDVSQLDEDYRNKSVNWLYPLGFGL